MGSIKALNIALIFKWWWRLRSDPSLLWSQVISSIHNLNSKSLDYFANMKILSLWKIMARVKKEMLKLGIPLSDVIVKIEIGNNTVWICSLSSDGIYLINILKKKIDQLTPINLEKIEWVKKVPNKVMCFIWKARMGRVPAATTLQKRGFNWTP